MTRYNALLLSLNEDILYSPSTIADHAVATGQFAPEEHRRVRIAMSATKGKFPIEGDGLVFKEGQAATPGWYGFRWKFLAEKRISTRRK